jgi:hypothetical protein
MATFLDPTFGVTGEKNEFIKAESCRFASSYRTHSIMMWAYGILNRS